MGCLTVILTRSGHGASASLTREGGGASVSFARQGGMAVRFGLVCRSGQRESYLYASDALLLTLSGGRLIVQRQRI
ncbi:MAG: hypothetical protein J5382_11960 [Bacteroidales bacterium]|nr:hypothetical protein [Bacteroidales bacterium]